jgi:hypothetical protein
MSLSKGKCWHSNNCLHFLNCAVPLIALPKFLIIKSVRMTCTFIFCRPFIILNVRRAYFILWLNKGSQLKWLLISYFANSDFAVAVSRYQKIVEGETLAKYLTNFLRSLFEAEMSRNTTVFSFSNWLISNYEWF